MSQWRDKADEVRKLSQLHARWRGTCLNMLAAESVASPVVREILGSDLSRRYFSPGVYSGDRYFRSILEIAEDLAKRLFGASFVDLRPVSGNVAVLSWAFGLAQPGDVIVTTPPEAGGYPLRITERYPVRMEYYPFDLDEMSIILEPSIELIRRTKPRIVICGASEFLFPYPAREIFSTAKEVGAVCVYDGAHVLGLIAGGEFQNPFSDGADIIGGSTQKTFYGPQGGINLVHSDEALYRALTNTTSAPPMLLSATHLNRIAALGVALAEFLEFGKDFAAQVVRNSQALGRSLAAEGFELFCQKHGFTRSHQVLLKNGGFCSEQGQSIKDRLEAANILVDSVVRIGVQEVTRLGMKESEMAVIARLMRRAVFDGEPAESVRQDVEELLAGFRRLQYTFWESNAYDYQPFL